MKTAIVKIKDIHPAAYNPKVTLKPGDEVYEALKNSLEHFGLAEPLIVNETTGTLISGHQRLNVLKENGKEEVEVVLVQADEEQEKLLNVALNKIEGDWVDEKVEALFEEISEEDIKFTGFTEDEVQNLFADAETDTATDDEEDAEEDGAEAEADEEEAETPEKPATEQEFNVFLSFPAKDLAEKWLKDRDVDIEYTGTARNITIRMEGIDYGA